ncbi:MAG: ATP-binding protein, partial [Candidatus Omnitrophica bacterium]|nr:ATP-binding protein [Candidatus Omnitrophota bacterium]
PPSKTAMLTLLKQARAFGLGIVLATQNPVDLDYKGLSNTGTWFIGRLQTERDKMRVMEGLEGAAASQAGFDRQKVEQTLAGLGNRVFLMNNVHEDAPVLFSTRWVLSYLSGPLSLDQIKRLAAQQDQSKPTEEMGQSEGKPSTPHEDTLSNTRPILPSQIEERFLPQRIVTEPNEKIAYRPALLGVGTLHYANSRAGVDEWRKVPLLAPLSGDIPTNPWTESVPFPGDTDNLFSEPDDGIGFGDLPAEAQNAKAHDKWKKMLSTHLYKECPLVLWKSKQPSLVSQPKETEEEFQGRLRQALREERDLAMEKLRDQYATKSSRIEDRIQSAQARVAKEESQYQNQRLQTAISFGSTLMGALFGRKLTSRTNIGKAATAIRGIGRTADQRGDIERAEEKVETLQADLRELEQQLQTELLEIRREFEESELEYDTQEIRTKKTDLTIDRYCLVWAPWAGSAGGADRPVY